MKPPEQIVLGLDFGGSKIAAALCSVDGRLRGERVVATDPGLGASANLDRGLAVARELLTDAGRDGSGGPPELAGVGACTFGIPREEGVELSPALPGWDRLPLRRRLEEALGAPVRVLTDVKAAAWAEARLGALSGANPGLYLNLGTGLAAAIVHDGKVVTGAHGASGEIGYNLRSLGDVWTSDPAAGPILENVVSGMGLSAAAARLGGDTGNGRPDRSTGASDAFRRARADPAFERLLADFLRELAYHLVNLAIAVDPERIAVGGGMVGSWDVLEPPLRSALAAHVPYPPELVVGAFPFDAALRGAVDAGLELARSLRAGGVAAAEGRLLGRSQGRDRPSAAMTDGR